MCPLLTTNPNETSLKNNEQKNRGIPGYTTNGLNMDKGFNLREAELFMFAPVDPYFDLYANLPIDENGISIEKAYAVTTALPAGFQIKGGKFKSNFSRLDAQLPHAWDFFDIALPYRAFLGDEGLGGEKGVQLIYLPPLPFYTLLGAGVLQGENDLLFDRRCKEKTSGPVPLDAWSSPVSQTIAYAGYFFMKVLLLCLLDTNIRWLHPLSKLCTARIQLHLPAILNFIFSTISLSRQ